MWFAHIRILFHPTLVLHQHFPRRTSTLLKRSCLGLVSSFPCTTLSHGGKYMEVGTVYHGGEMEFDWKLNIVKPVKARNPKNIGFLVLKWRTTLWMILKVQSTLAQWMLMSGHRELGVEENAPAAPATNIKWRHPQTSKVELSRVHTLKQQAHT